MRRRRGWRPGWRGLGWFWTVVLLIAGGGSGVLAWLGTPGHEAVRQAEAPARVARAVIPAPVVLPVPSHAATKAIARPGRDTPGPVADPDPTLLEPSADQPGLQLPRIAADGRMPMQVYAAGYDHTSRRPRVGLVLAGVGLNEADSAQAIRSLPGGVTLAISPYAVKPERLLDAARMAEHEYLLSIPMEPQSFPLNDPGDHALLTRLAPDENVKRLDWALSRFAGYVGATGALGLMHGERFAAVNEDIDPVLATLARRGLLYVDPRTDAGTLPSVWQRRVDVVIDDPPEAAAIDAKLAALDKLAAEKGSALGLAGAVRPVTVERIAAWANKLAEHGLALAPVSALAVAPARVEATQ